MKWFVMTKELKKTINNASSGKEAIIQAIKTEPIEHLGLIIIASPLSFDRFPLQSPEQADKAIGWKTPDALYEAKRITKEERELMLLKIFHRFDAGKL